LTTVSITEIKILEFLKPQTKEQKMKNKFESDYCNYHVFVVESDKQIIDRLISSINSSKASQILITGPNARSLISEDDNTFKDNLKDNWTFFKVPYLITGESMKKALLDFTKSIKLHPDKKHIYIGPTKPDEVVDSLFFKSDNLRDYSCAIYVIGIYPHDPLSHLEVISKSFGDHPRLSGEVISIYAKNDVNVISRFRHRLNVAETNNENIKHLTYLYFRYLCIMRSFNLQTITGDDRLSLLTEKTIDDEIIPFLFPEEMQTGNNIKPWWKIWLY
jgi:hypothetical protein